MTAIDQTPQNDRMLKIVVMNDLHLVAPESAVPNMGTTTRFEQALANASNRHRDADLCVFAGNIADKADAEAYEVFDRMRKRYQVPQCVTLGNHDDRNVFKAIAKDFEVDPNGYIQCRRDIKRHCILVLDSSEPNTTRGAFLR